jgi:hypothetical protein
VVGSLRLEAISLGYANAPLLGVLAERMTDEPNSSIFETARVRRFFWFSLSKKNKERKKRITTMGSLPIIVWPIGTLLNYFPMRDESIVSGSPGLTALALIA